MEYDGDIPVDPGDELQPLEAEWGALRAAPGDFDAAVALATAADALVRERERVRRQCCWCCECVWGKG